MFELTTFSIIAILGTAFYFKATLASIFGRTENTATLVVNTSFDAIEKTAFLASKTTDTALVLGLNGLAQAENVTGVTKTAKADALAQFEAFRSGTPTAKTASKK